MNSEEPCGKGGVESSPRKVAGPGHGPGRTHMDI